MLRWDCCASGNLKLALSEGTPLTEIPPRVRNALPIDMRLLDILVDWPRIELPVLKRPWLTNPLVVDGYPVEYRAFVEDGEIAGISSYYPQRPLRRNDRELAAVRKMTEALIATVETPFEWLKSADADLRTSEVIHGMAGKLKNAPTPKKPRIDPNGIHFSADFIATNSPEGVLFLEGGPPHFMGAHPCCFEPGKVRGIALTPGTPPEHLDSLSCPATADTPDGRPTRAARPDTELPERRNQSGCSTSWPGVRTPPEPGR